MQLALQIATLHNHAPKMVFKFGSLFLEIRIFAIIITKHLEIYYILLKHYVHWIETKLTFD